MADFLKLILDGIVLIVVYLLIVVVSVLIACGGTMIAVYIMNWILGGFCNG